MAKEQKQSLFNAYEAETEAARKFDRELEPLVQKIIKLAQEEGYSLNEVELILLRTINGLFAEARLKAGIKLKREIRAAAKTTSFITNLQNPTKPKTE